MNFHCLLVINVIYHCVSSSNILFVGVIESISHRIWYEQLIGGLVEKGHNITLLSYADPKLKRDNYTVIKITGVMEILADKIGEIINPEFGVIQSIRNLWTMYVIPLAEFDMKSDALKTILDYPKDKFDLIIFDIFNSQHLYPLVDYFGDPPVIGVSPLGLSPSVFDAMGSHSYSYYPIYISKDTDRMNFLQRARNWMFYRIDNCYRWYYMEKLQELARSVFGQDAVRIEDVEKRFRILLANYDPILNYPVSLPPNIIPVGGLHTKRSTKLSDDVQKILDNAENGVIYFSLGTFVLPSIWPMEKKKIFLEVFSKLNQTILWKYEDNDLTDVPGNVIVRKWFPQNNILAHKNVKLFITHGGALSVHETIYNGVPVVGLPFMYDQLTNVAMMKARNLGKELSLSTLNTDTLYEAINEVLDNPKYLENIRKISKAFRSEKETPLERAVFWIEYVLEHKDLSYYDTRGRSMTWYQRDNLDIFGFYLLFIIITMLLMVKLLKLLLISYLLPKNGGKLKQN